MKLRLSLLVTIPAVIAGCTKIDSHLGESSDFRFEQSMEWNRTHSAREIVVQSDDYTIMAAADSHVGTTGNLDSFFRIASASNVSAVLMSGDLTSGRSEDYAVFEEHLPDRDSMNIFLSAGNHDLWYDGWDEFSARFGSSSYYITVKTPEANDLIICIDTGSGTLGDYQMEWLRKILETVRPEYRHCMVFTHNNFFRVNQNLISNPPVEELESLIELFTKSNVEMVFTGHDHKRDATLFGNTTYLQVSALKDGEEEAGYCKINVKKDKLDYEFRNL
ncbi:MAG: metallophosphoesterase [Bacteroidota bacterium]|nr:metallophosphoesterase [Bacteroidota bacterium]